MAAILSEHGNDISGTLAQRPTASRCDIGQRYFASDEGIHYVIAYAADGTTLTWVATNVKSVSYNLPATPIDALFFIANRACIVIAIRFRPLVVASGATALVKKVPSGTAVASGTALHTENTATGFLLDGTTNVVQVATLTGTRASLCLVAGDGLGVDVSGTTTNGTGVITVDYVDLA